jgi:hypothetical protein
MGGIGGCRTGGIGCCGGAASRPGIQPACGPNPGCVPFPFGGP